MIQHISVGVSDDKGGEKANGKTSATSRSRRPGKSHTTTNQAVTEPMTNEPMATNNASKNFDFVYFYNRVSISWAKVSAESNVASNKTPKMGRRHNSAIATAKL